jgi:hypothetical protein
MCENRPIWSPAYELRRANDPWALVATRQCQSDILGRKRVLCGSGLPEGLFSNQKSQFGKNFQGLRFKNVVTYILWSFGIL